MLSIKPAYITFTGVDRTEIIPQMQALSARFPIEWGVLLDPEQEHLDLFPSLAERLAVQSSGLRLSAHICGKPAADIISGDMPRGLDLSGFSRVQINHGRQGSSAQQIDHAHRFAASRGVRVALQCQGEFPDEPVSDWLFDVSFGLGERPKVWPSLGLSSAFCGYSGGISPATAAATLAALPLTKADDGAFWLDMESGVRSNGLLDLDKCEQVCEIVFSG